MPDLKYEDRKMRTVGTSNNINLENELDGAVFESYL
jgi:hypothetical protein